MIEPEAIYTLTKCAALTGHSYYLVRNAVQRGLLLASRDERGRYQVRGADLIAWRDRVPTPCESTAPDDRPLPSGASLASLASLTAAEIRTMRTRLGLTQAQFACRLRFTRTSVVNWESGRIRPSTEAARAIKQLVAEMDGPGRA